MSTKTSHHPLVATSVAPHAAAASLGQVTRPAPAFDADDLQVLEWLARAGMLPSLHPCAAA